MPAWTSKHGTAWTGTASGSPAVPTFIGLAPRFEVEWVALELGDGRVKVHNGTRAVVSTAGEPWPLFYLAVRDPSVLKVEQLEGMDGEGSEGRASGAFWHARLRFATSERPTVAALMAEGKLGWTDGDPATAPFILTVGLPREDEHAFYAAIAAAHPDGPWTDVYTRLAALGRGELRSP